MLRGFGKNLNPVFILPYYGYDTLKIITELNCRIFSTDKISRMRDKRFIKLLVRIPLNKYAKIYILLVRSFYV